MMPTRTAARDIHSALAFRLRFVLSDQQFDRLQRPRRGIVSFVPRRPQAIEDPQGFVGLRLRVTLRLHEPR